MSDRPYAPVDPLTARSRYGALFRKTGATDADRAFALTDLATANIERAIRDAKEACPHPLHPAQVEYLCGLITAMGQRA